MYSAIIRYGIAMALGYAAAGTLPQMTKKMMYMAAEAQPHLISLSKLNRALTGTGQTHRYRAAKNAEK